MILAGRCDKKRALLLGFAVHVGNVVPGHEARKHRHHHLGLHLRDVLGQSVDSGTNLTGHRNGVLGIRQIILIKLYIN